MSGDDEVDNPSNNIHDDRAFAPLKLVDHDCGKDQTEHNDDDDVNDDNGGCGDGDDAGVTTRLAMAKFMSGPCLHSQVPVGLCLEATTIKLHGAALGWCAF